MKIIKKSMNFENSIGKEWIITNGIGGYSSSTIIGCNTRRYHGLLVAPIDPPTNRHVILSKLDESVIINERKYDLFTNISSNFISEGYKQIESFEKNPLPEFTYKIEDAKIVKKISLVYEHNTVVINYSIKNDNFYDMKMTIAPIMTFKGFHDMMTNHQFNVEQNVCGNNVEIVIDNNKPIYMYSNEGRYIKHENDQFDNMYYMKEEQRGFDAEENLCVPGIYEFELKAKTKKDINIIVSLEPNIDKLDVANVFDSEIKRLEELVEKSDLLCKKKRLSIKEKNKNKFINDLVIATDNFVINRPKNKLHSVIAGYPWFLDWGRDTAISYEGLFLVTKRYDLAREILLFLTKDIKCGLVPNGYCEDTNKPLYNSADSSLLLFEQINKFLKYTKDLEFVKENLYEKLKDIIANYRKGINLANNNIYIDEDELLVSGTQDTQNTWMDAKIGDYAVTPRNGKTVELNALWYNALKTMEYLAKKFDKKEETDEYRKLALKHKKSFNSKFYNESKKSLYDVLGDSKIRPNQLFSISTTYPVIDPSSDIAKKIYSTVKNNLYTRYGLRTLARDENGYCTEYSGDAYKRDMSYHQGTVWVWLLGLYYDALKNIIDCEKDRIEKEKYIIEQEKFIENVYNTFSSELYEGECLCNISELYNAERPFIPGGTFAQAWSVSEVLRIILNYEL